MALSCSKVARIQSPLLIGKGFNRQNAAIVRASQVMILPSQKQREEKKAPMPLAIHEPLQLKHTSTRRDAMVFLTASLLTPLLPVGSVEARTTKAENKRRVKERLDKLREKARVSKPKDDSGSAIGKNKSESGQSNQLTEIKKSLLEVVNPQWH